MHNLSFQDTNEEGALMRNFFLIFALYCCFLYANQPSKQPIPPAKESLSPSSFIETVLKEYQEGKYKNFLEKQHKSYEESHKKWEYNGMLEKRKQLSSLVYDPLKKEGKKEENSYKEKLLVLEKKIDKELLEICLAHPHDPLCHSVKEMLSFTPSTQEKEALAFLDTIARKYKGEGVTPLENKLINIDTEFWLKALSLDISLTENKIDSLTHKKGCFVLALEKLTSMKKACDMSEEGKHFTSHIEKVSQLYPKMQTVSLTRKHLLSLGEGKAFPQNELEVRIQKVMKSYLEEEKKLISADH